MPKSISVSLIPLLILLHSSLISCAQTQTATTIMDVKRAMDKIEEDPVIRTGTFGFCLMDASSGEVLIENHSKKSLMTASTMKAITSAAAMNLLGPQTKFPTYLEYSGEIDTEETLNGDIFIRGTGDPALASTRYHGDNALPDLMNKWVAGIKESGIKKINGRIIGDGSAYPSHSIPETWLWQDMGNYYAAGAAGLNIHENLYYLYFKTGKPGTQTEILRTEPQIPGLEFHNEVTAGPIGSGDMGYIFGAPYTWMRYVRGTIPPNRSEFSIKGSIPEPALFAAQILEENLNAAGISTSSEASSVRQLKLAGTSIPSNRNIILKEDGTSVSDIVYWLNKKSVNLFGESLVRQCSKDGSINGGLKAIRDYWESKGIDLDGFDQVDGSGLSRKNGVTTRQMTEMLKVMASSDAFDDYFKSLPVAGVSTDDGSLKSMCDGTPAEGRVFAKSGFIAGVRSYAGYVKTPSGRLLCFSMIANNFTCSPSAMRLKLEKLMIAIGSMD